MPETSLQLRFDGQTYVVPRGKMFIVGRGSSCDLRIRNPRVSRRHLVVWYKDGWLVEDLGTTNGTFHRGQQIEREYLSGDATFRIGDPSDGPLLELFPPVGSPADHAPQEATELAAVLASVDAPPLLSRPDQVSLAPSGELSDILAQLDAPPLLTAPTADERIEVRGFGLAAHAPGGLQVRSLSYRLPGGGKQLLRNISLDAPRGTLTAVVGPSGAGKSTFAKAVSGLTKPFAGQAAFDGLDIHKDQAQAQAMVGMVPQEDVIHRQLTVSAALRYAASLRLVGSQSAEGRKAQVDKVVGQLGMEAHLGTRIARLSGGQRKRASVALELLTEPSLLILDEPTSGLDPALDRQLMVEFRGLADGGRSVLVITHSVACLDMCDQVLVLVPGGATAFLGSEQAAFAHFGTDDWSEIFSLLKEDPALCEQRWQSSQLGESTAQSPVQAPTAPVEVPRRVPSWSQLLTLVRRQFALMIADRGYSLFLLALPFVIGLLPLVVPGEVGLTRVQQMENSQEPRTILALLIIGAIFIGISMSIRELVSERTIYERERAVGLSPGAYLASKLIVYNLLAVFCAVIIVRVTGLVKDLPTGDGVFGIGATWELTIAIFVTISSGVSLGLLLSSLVSSQQQVMPVLIVVLMAQMVLNGGLISLVDNDGLNAASKAVPARWSLAMGASSVDLEHLLDLPESADPYAVNSPAAQSGAAQPGVAEAGSAQPEGSQSQGVAADEEQSDGSQSGEYDGIDPMWESSRARWLTSAAVLAAMALAMTVASWFKVRRRSRG